jgi:hypothetical protein
MRSVGPHLVGGMGRGGDGAVAGRGGDPIRSGAAEQEGSRRAERIVLAAAVAKGFDETEGVLLGLVASERPRQVGARLVGFGQGPVGPRMRWSLICY